MSFAAALNAPAEPFNGQYWVRGARASPSALHSVVIGVQLKDGAADSCDSALLAISTPGSPRFHKFLSFKEAGEMFRNHAAEAKTVAWLRRHGVQPREMRKSPNGEFVRVTTTVAKLERLLGATYFQYAAKEDSKHVIVRDLSYAVPAALKSFVDFVSDTYVLPVPPSVASKAFHFAPLDLKKRQSGNVSPALLNSFYKITSNSVVDARSTQSLFESLGQSYAPSDLVSFQQSYNLPQTPIAKVVGANTPSQCTAANPNPCFEASLDVQFILAIAQNATTWFWSVNSNGDIFLQWIEALASTPNPPLIHSMSYASIAPEDPKYDVERFNTEMCKLGLKGLTLFVASGDDGVANFVARNSPSQCGFTPCEQCSFFLLFFSLLTHSLSLSLSLSLFSLSLSLSQPSRPPRPTRPLLAPLRAPRRALPRLRAPRRPTASSRRAEASPPTSSGPTGRTRPCTPTSTAPTTCPRAPPFPRRAVRTPMLLPWDTTTVSLFSFVCFILFSQLPLPAITVGGSVFVGSGTSASTPVVAGQFTLINGLRLRQGKGPVGWLNPILYQLGANRSAIFNDISSGENNCCAGYPGQQTCCSLGFTAARSVLVLAFISRLTFASHSGWDPLTGWGTMNFNLLSEYFVSLP